MEFNGCSPNRNHPHVHKCDSRRAAVQEQQLEVSVGDVIQIGDYVVTVVDIDGTDVSFRVDQQQSDEFALAFEDSHSPSPPGK